MLYRSRLLTPRIACLIIVPATHLLEYPDCGYLEPQRRKLPYFKDVVEGHSFLLRSSGTSPPKNMTEVIRSSSYLKNE